MFREHRWKETALRLFRAAFSSYVHAQAQPGHLEVERKFHLTADEAQRLPDALREAGFKSIGLAAMSDSFLPGLIPGEMLRVRREQIDSAPVQHIFTFKQWVDTSTGKERQETERIVRPAVAAFWLLVGRMLQGGPLMQFSKRRHLYEGDLDGANCVASIDDVFGLGSFSGWYMEIELIVPLGEDPTPFRDRIFPLAQKLLGETRAAETRSYRDMLIASLQN
jgi:adenylate cyclase class IV